MMPGALCSSAPARELPPKNLLRGESKMLENTLDSSGDSSGYEGSRRRPRTCFQIATTAANDRDVRMTSRPKVASAPFAALATAGDSSCPCPARPRPRPRPRQVFCVRSPPGLKPYPWATPRSVRQPQARPNLFIHHGPDHSSSSDTERQRTHGNAWRLAWPSLWPWRWPTWSSSPLQA